MKRFSPAQTVASLFALFATFIPAAHAQYTNGQSASIVLGQSSFSTGGFANPPTQSSLKSPAGVVSDPVTGKLFVVDTGNNRILRFSSAAAAANGSAAEIVFGQAAFNTNTGGSTASTLNAPVGAALDSSGNLWVADASNNRVLRYTGATTIATSGASADLALGATSPAVAGSTAVAQNTMNGPTGVSFASNGSLFVTDRGNNRILRFDNPSSLVNGTLPLPANGVLGQVNFLANGAGTTASSLSGPTGLAVDSSNNVWVADFGNNRALRFSSATSAPNGASANLVVGQTDFISAIAATTSTGLAGPAAATFDTLGRLYISDYLNNRVLVYNSPSTMGSGAAANFVLGQSDFVTNTSGLAANKFANPYGLSFATAGSLWVVDNGAANSRVLNFVITAGIPSISSSPTSPKLQSGKTKSFKVNIANLSSAPDGFTVGAIITTASKKKTKSVTFTYAGLDVTTDILAGTLSTSQIAAGQPAVITVKVTARNATKGGKGPFNITFNAASETITSNTTSKTVKSTIKTD